VIQVRSVICLALMFVITLLFALPLAVFGRFLSAPVQRRMAAYWASGCLWALNAVCGLRYRVTGEGNFPTEASVVMCKHQSAWETIALRLIVPGDQVWVLKQELLRVPVFGGALRCFNPIAVDRKAGRKAARQLLEQGKSALDAGRSVIIFPEGTRVASGEHKDYGVGGAMLAEHARRPVVPIAHNAGVFWPRRSLAKYPGVIDVVVGPVILTEGKRALEINREVEHWIETTVAALPTDRSAT